jgi:DNA-binding NtrC family response regulator
MSAEERPTVMVVDDEEMVVSSLRFFLELETAYKVAGFTSPSEALRYLAEHDVDVVVSDYLMPEMDGLRFLGRVRETRPEVPRIILTGYADKENAIKAINDIGLYQYIEKPWNNEDLRIVLRNAIEKKRLFQRLQEKVKEINRAYGELQGIQQELLKAFA